MKAIALISRRREPPLMPPAPRPFEYAFAPLAVYFSLFAKDRSGDPFRIERFFRSPLSSWVRIQEILLIARRGSV